MDSRHLKKIGGTHGKECQSILFNVNMIVSNKNVS